MGYLPDLLLTPGLPPHGFCLLWQPELIRLHTVSDAVIGLSYYAIPLALAYFVRRRKNLAFGWMFWWFAAFILACGTTHFIEILTLWYPAYGIQGLVKAVTAVVSLLTALMLWPLVMRALAFPTPAEFQRVSDQLAAREAERNQALASSRRFAAEVDVERQRLQAAVSNMPIGLSMFDSDERLIICNRAYGEMYGLPAHLTGPGTRLNDILRNTLASGTSQAIDLEEYRAEIAESGATGKRALRLLELQDGRTISTIVQTMDDGGWVAVHEDITERRRAEARIQHMARHDALTELPNRLLFRDKITEALIHVRRGESVGILCLDLDHFKNVNDTLGHPTGDLLLKAVAGRLKRCTRETDTVARLGGDEFAIIQVGSAEQPQGATVLAERIIAVVSAPYEIDGHQIAIGASVGIAISPNDGAEPDVLLKNSDMALYCAKADGRSAYRCFDTAMDSRIQARRVLELELRHALVRNEFEMFYQPVIDIKRNAITSFEALLRWRHPERGIVSPSAFIPVAEEKGIIVPIGEWVLQQACRDAAAWPDDITVAVNISPTQFKSQKLLQAVIFALKTSGLPATRLELEITEGVLLIDTEATLDVLNRLRAIGVRIAMDDFGTGYSSLSHLHKFPFDRIKLDRSFISNTESQDGSLGIIRAVAGLGASFHMATTAEGVETAEQVERLRTEGYDALQGYFFGRPGPACEVERVLAGLRV